MEADGRLLQRRRWELPAASVGRDGAGEDGGGGAEVGKVGVV